MSYKTSPFLLLPDPDRKEEEEQKAEKKRGFQIMMEGDGDSVPQEQKRIMWTIGERRRSNLKVNTKLTSLERRSARDKASVMLSTSGTI